MTVTTAPTTTTQTGASTGLTASPVGFTIALSVDPSRTSPAEVATFAAATLEELTRTLAAAGVALTGPAPVAAAGVSAAGVVSAAAASSALASGPGHIPGLAQQLGRLMDHNPVFAPRVQQVHDALVKLGYTPTLPKSAKATMPSYVSYIDPKTGLNLGNLNSEKFYVMRANLRDELAAQKHFGADQRYAHCHLTGPESVDALIEMAGKQKS